ncbi:MAG: hypothetical protein PUC41_06925 [Oscillospiraceae bacterium]|nr:hypothetical protein [Oscillospiraceae bacterium]
MGERIRRIARYCFVIFYRSAAPAMLIACLVFIFGMAFPDLLPTPLLITLVSWITCAAVVAGDYRKEPPKGTPEYDATVRLFGGSGKRDRLFSKAMQAFCEDEIPYALELFLMVREQKCNAMQQSACCHYMGRCYLQMGCAANARQFFDEAQAGGFAPEINLLFHARACGHAGDVEASAASYRQLIAMNPPQLEIAEADMGMMYLHNDCPAEALACFTHSLTEGKAYCDCLGGIAVAQLYLGHAEESEQYYHKTLRAMDAASVEGFKAFYEEAKQEMAHKGEE